MDNLQYSRPIDVHRISEYPEVQKVISFLLSLLKEAGLIKGSPRDKVLRHLQVVVLDLYPTMKEPYPMLVPDSIPAIKPKMGANTDPNQPSFK